MRTFSLFCAIATGCIALHAIPAAAQDFEHRWSIIPKAHADPLPPPAPDNTAAQPPSTNEPAASSEEHTPTTGSAKRVFSGKASFYSYRKSKTATGSSFDRDELTAAHRSLPFGTRVRVTDLATNKSVVVSITDRGPFIRSRVLDLSLAAARSLGITDRGVVEIRAEVL